MAAVECMHGKTFQCAECFNMAHEYIPGFVTLTQAVSDSYSHAREKGFHTTGQTFGDKMMLAVSELSEALEEYRNGRLPDEIYFVLDDAGNPKPEGVPIEMMDCLIRLFDDFGFYNIPINTAYNLKTEYNKTRTFRHGGKRL
jgi:hypothetical protein